MSGTAHHRLRRQRRTTGCDDNGAPQVATTTFPSSRPEWPFICILLTVRWPADEINASEDVVRSLLTVQHPDLAQMALWKFGAGWDNTLWRLGEDFLVRLPRRAAAAPLMINEQRWLPELAPRLPLPIPAPVRIGRPSSEYPWAWSIVAWIDGRPGDVTTIDPPDHAATTLGRFLRALHQPASEDAPENNYRGVALEDRSKAFDDHMAALDGKVDAVGVRRVWDRALGAQPWQGPPLWIHGDLHPANILVRAGRLAAVIDFGDLTGGDPATDLAATWMLLPDSAVPALVDAYGGFDPDLEIRALGWAILFALMLLAIGLGGHSTYEAVGRATLARTIAYSDRNH